MSTKILLLPDISQGTVTSNPEPWEAGKTMISLKGLLSDPDMKDASKSMSICLESSYDGGTNWQSGPKAPWVGNTPNPFVPGTFIPPNVATSFTGSGAPPTHVRVRLDLNGIVSVGAAVTFE